LSVCRKGQSDIITPVYNIKDVALDSCKDLGVITDSHLKFSKHISEKRQQHLHNVEDFKEKFDRCLLSLFFLLF